MSLASAPVSAESPRPQIPAINLHGKLLSHQTGLDGSNGAIKTPIMKENTAISSEYARRCPQNKFGGKVCLWKGSNCICQSSSGCDASSEAYRSCRVTKSEEAHDDGKVSTQVMRKTKTPRFPWGGL